MDLRTQLTNVKNVLRESKKGHFNPLISGLGVKVGINTVNIEYLTPLFPL